VVEVSSPPRNANKWMEEEGLEKLTNNSEGSKGEREGRERERERKEGRGERESEGRDEREREGRGEREREGRERVVMSKNRRKGLHCSPQTTGCSIMLTVFY